MAQNKVEGKLTSVRLPDTLRARIDAVAGPNRMAIFIREAVEAELRRREAAAKKKAD